jgi:hypothetical protein
MNNVVYLHRRKDSGEIFYVGIGEPKRPYRKDNRNDYWHHIVNKCGYNVEIVHTNLSWEEACELERMLISEYGRKDLGLGSLVNMTDGGDGKVGFVFSEESKKKIGDSNRGKKIGEKNPFFGKQHPPELIEQIKQTKKLNPWIPTPEQKDKWASQMRGRKIHDDESINKISHNMPHQIPVDVWKESQYVGRWHAYSAFIREVMGFRARTETNRQYRNAASKICGMIHGRNRLKTYKGYTIKLVNNE